MRRGFGGRGALLAIAALSILVSVQQVHADDSAGYSIVQTLFDNDPPKAQTQEAVKKEVRRVPEPAGSPLPNDHLSVGLNYTGGQVRWHLSPRWAIEGRAQFGSADSNYGTVHAHVIGLRGYRFASLTEREHWLWYCGGELAYAEAESSSYNYRTQGTAAGAFGGLEYRLTRRIAIDADLGPYVISLKEKETNISSTNLDFVVNTALVFKIF